MKSEQGVAQGRGQSRGSQVQPLISCIVPVFNGERFLSEALDSIFDQTYRPVEVIVVDDGSMDGTAGVAAACGDRIQYLWQTNAGPCTARNRGRRTSIIPQRVLSDRGPPWPLL